MILFKLKESKKESLYSECRYQFVRSSGPGGQKVNKTATKAELYWILHQTNVFTSEQVARLKAKLSNRYNKEGEIFFASDRYRTRPQNQQHCFRKLVAAIEKALSVEKKRKATKPTRASVEKRIKNKKKHAEKKQSRQKVF